MRGRAFGIVLLAGLLSATGAQAAGLSLEGDLKQGALIRGKTEPGAVVTLDAPLRLTLTALPYR